MRASTVFALLATVAVSFAAPGTYTPAPSTPPAPDAAGNTPPPAGPPTTPSPAGSPAGPPSPASSGQADPPSGGATTPPVPAPAPAGYCNTNQASFCCNGDAAAAGGFLSLLGLGGCGLAVLTGGCTGAKTYCCAQNQNGLINLGLCGSLLGDIL